MDYAEVLGMQWALRRLFAGRFSHADAIATERTNAFPETAPGDQIPVAALADVAHRFDFPRSHDGVPVDVGDAKDLPGSECLCEFVRHHCRGALVKEMDAHSKFRSLSNMSIVHDGSDFPERRTGRVSERRRRQHPKRDCHGESFVNGEPERRQGVRPIKTVATGTSRFCPNRDATLLERRQVPLNGARTDTKFLGKPPGTPRARRHSSQLLNECVEPVRASHVSIL